MSASIQLHDTLARRRAPLRTEQPDRVTMYVCGPTVCNYAHIGNARPAVVFDLLAHLLRSRYEHVQTPIRRGDAGEKAFAPSSRRPPHNFPSIPRAPHRLCWPHSRVLY